MPESILENQENPPYITTRKWPAGYFMVLVKWDAVQGGYTIDRSGPTPYRTRKKAANAAKLWAESTHMEYRA